MSHRRREVQNAVLSPEPPPRAGWRNRSQRTTSAGPPVSPRLAERGRRAPGAPAATSARPTDVRTEKGPGALPSAPSSSAALSNKAKPVCKQVTRLWHRNRRPHEPLFPCLLPRCTPPRPAHCPLPAPDEVAGAVRASRCASPLPALLSALCPRRSRRLRANCAKHKMHPEAPALSIL